MRTRTGAPEGKDARLKNSYVEGKGDPTQPGYQSVVRKRPQAQGGVAVGTGTAQGGIGFSIAGVPYFIGVFGDAANGSALTGGSTAITPYGASVGTNWAAGTAYSIGDHVIVDFVDYWAAYPNDNIDPTLDPYGYWSKSPSGCVSTYPPDRILGSSTTGPYPTSPTVPSPILISSEIMKRYCAGTLIRKVEIVYSVVTDINGTGYNGYPTREYALWMYCSTLANADWLHGEPRNFGGYTTWWKYNNPAGVWFVYPSGLPIYNDTPSAGTGAWFGAAANYEPTVAPKTWYYLKAETTETYYIA